MDQLQDFEFENGAWFERPGLRITTSGTRKTLLIPPGPDQLERLAEAARDALQPGELAIGAIPFTREQQIILSIPESFNRIDAPDPLEEPEPQSARELRIEAFPSPQRYEQAVTRALDLIERGEIQKVVLARMLIAHSENRFDRRRLLRLLATREPAAYRFAVQGFIGASPELLCARTGNQVSSQPLAGTRPLARADELITDPKDLAEHAFVAESIRSTFDEFAGRVDSQGPFVFKTSSLAHLATRITGTLRSAKTSVLDVVAQLHPTAAVAGVPRFNAMQAIRGIEGFDRSLYSGAVGWIDGSGDGEWALMLRCAEVRGRMATLFAGAGIVAGSSPEAERMETEAKFEPMRKALELC